MDELDDAEFETLLRNLATRRPCIAQVAGIPRRRPCIPCNKIIDDQHLALAGHLRRMRDCEQCQDQAIYG